MSDDNRTGADATTDRLAPIERRAFLGGVGLFAGALLAEPGEAQQATVPAATPAPGLAPVPMLALDEDERAFLLAAVDHLIPATPGSPSASEAGVVTFIDRQLASAWGGGAGSYRSGPFKAGTPQQGYQLPLTPRGYFATGIAAANRWCANRFGSAFDQLPPARQHEALELLDAGKAELDGIDGRAFFEELLQITQQGYFADPVHGGNAGMAGWRLLGFPGLPAFYAGTVAGQGGKRYVADPKSIADFL